ncbi:nuclear transport factor 2 family protein [Henriciella marina]|uniref:Nuclear transport factor 2 family protein n=1 Tax=Henriciella marina TaxID=453851 RepID=A0ABT4LXW9_9PROT|nr:nuclear transport factor 2 family protein [Henriciella marina]MCZ4297989.1 nuclear transport factor 2 family protein [Henriciella marina]
MPKFPQLWEVEKQLWTGPAENYDRLMAQDCVMVFPLPAGILSRDAIIETVRLAPRWDDVELDSVSETQSNDTTITLAYVGRGLKGSDTYEAYCSSTYILVDGDWRIVQHQQTPA